MPALYRTFSTKINEITVDLTNDMYNSSATLLNHQKVLYLIRTRGPLSRAEISRITNLTKATISKIVDGLEQRQLIISTGLEKQGRGRPSLLYQFNSAAAISIGIEILDDEVQAVVTQMDAQPLRSFSTPLSDSKSETVLNIVEEIVTLVKEDFSNPILGIGIGLPGVCDAQQRNIILSERLNWRNLPLARMIQDRTTLETYVENRANAAALGERWYGLGRDSENFVYIQIGSGFKAGVVLNGSLYLGSNGSAGEIGHITIARDGPLCVCGKRGCLESLASTDAILARINALIRAGKAESMNVSTGQRKGALQLEDMIAAAQRSDLVAIEVLVEAAKYLGIALAHLTNLFNPKKIILGPFASQVPEIFIETVRKTVREYTFELTSSGLEIIPTELGQQAVAIGAAALVLEKDLQALQDQLL